MCFFLYFFLYQKRISAGGCTQHIWWSGAEYQSRIHVWYYSDGESAVRRRIRVVWSVTRKRWSERSPIAQMIFSPLVTTH